MGLCTSRSTVSLAPSAHALSHMEEDEEDSETGTPTWDERLSMIQSTKVIKASEAGGGVRSSGPNAPAKGYLELGSKCETEPHLSREPEEEEEEEEGDGEVVEELLNFSESEGSLRSEILE